MLSGASSSAVISLLSESSEEEVCGPVKSSPVHRPVSKRELRVQLSEVSVSSTVRTEWSPHKKSCGQRAAEYLLDLDIEQLVHRHLSDSESQLLSRVTDLCSSNDSACRVLSTLLGRQWPKWHSVFVRQEDITAFDALVSAGAVNSVDSVIDDPNQTVSYPNLSSEPRLCENLDIHKSSTFLDLFLSSLPVPTLRRLIHIPANRSITRPALIEKLKAAYNGKQRTIFGGLNDMSLLIKKVYEPDRRFAMLSEDCRSLFVTLSYVLDIDSTDEFAWDSALPQTLLLGFANKGIVSLTPRSLARRQHIASDCPASLQVFQSRSQIEITRLLDYFHAKIESKKLCPKIISANIRNFLVTLNLDWTPNSCVPEWWYRRQLPRRCSNLLWKCIAELERLKFYDLALDHLRYMLANSDALLGRKRRGKVILRLLIELGHLGIPIEQEANAALQLDLFEADRAEILRRLAGDSLKSFSWPCGAIHERTIEVYGAKSRDFNWVEQAALDHYYLSPSGGYEKGLHCEGRVMMEIFSSLFSQVLVPPLPIAGTWQSPLQRWALDVGFLQADVGRWGEAEAVLSEIASKDYEALADMYMSQNPPLRSDFPIQEILSCMRGPVLAGIMRLIMQDPYYWGGGQPDILAWNVEERKIIFSEVKGPGDQLSPRQRWWLSELTKCSAIAEVCYVVDEGDNETVKKSKGKKKRKISIPPTPLPSKTVDKTAITPPAMSASSLIELD